MIYYFFPAERMKEVTDRGHNACVNKQCDMNFKQDETNQLVCRLFCAEQ